MVNKKTIGIHLRGNFIQQEVPGTHISGILEQANKYAALGYQFFIATDGRLLEEAEKYLPEPHHTLRSTIMLRLYGPL